MGMRGRVSILPVILLCDNLSSFRLWNGSMFSMRVSKLCARFSDTKDFNLYRVVFSLSILVMPSRTRSSYSMLSKSDFIAFLKTISLSINCLLFRSSISCSTSSLYLSASVIRDEAREDLARELRDEGLLSSSRSSVPAIIEFSDLKDASRPPRSTCSLACFSAFYIINLASCTDTVGLRRAS